MYRRPAVRPASNHGIITSMNIFREFEKKLESLFEGVILRAFKSGVQPVELGKKLVRELEGHKTIGVSRVYVPNRYLSLIHISEPTRLGMISYAVFCLK